jgi:tetratricopeptide (TPR) repeat protein
MSTYPSSNASSRRHAFFLGAGASLPEPSGLATFGHIRNGFISHLSKVIRQVDTQDITLPQQDHIVKNLKEVTPPEAIFRLLDQIDRTALQRGLLQVLSGGTPNKTHHAAANLLAAGGVVWTTNFDTLIERAAGLEPIADPRIAFDQRDLASFTNPNVRLIKPHGSLARFDSLIFRSQDVFRLLPQPIRDRLVQDVKDYFFVFLGYRAWDLDLKPILSDAVNQFGEGLWFTKPEEENYVKETFAAAVETGRLQICAAEKPSELFWKWSSANGLLSGLPTEVISSPNIEPLVSLVDNPRIAASLLRRCGALSIARSLLWDELCGLRLSALEPYFSILRQQRSSVGQVYDAIRAVLNLIRPSTFDNGLYRLAYTFFESGAYSVASSVAGLSISRASPTRRVQLGASLRMAGRLEEALAVLPTVPQDDPDLVDLEARVAFERAISLRWLGRETEALALIQAVRDRVAHAGTHWTGWFYFEEATCLTLRNNTLAAERTALKADDIFRGTENLIGRIDTQILLCTVCRLRGQPDEAWKYLESADQLLQLDGGRRSFTRRACEFERGELLRINGRYEEAARSYRQLRKTRSRLHRSHGFLGLAELERDRGQLSATIEFARYAKRGYNTIGCRWGECQAIVTLYLAGDFSKDAAEREIRETAYDVPGLDALIFDYQSGSRALNLP